MHLLVFDKKNEDEKTPTIKSGQCLMLAWFSIIGIIPGFAISAAEKFRIQYFEAL